MVVKSRRVQIIALFSGLLILILLLCLASSSVSKNQSRPEVINGSLDLSDWNFKKDGNVKLDGTWEFYWDRIVIPQSFRMGTERPTGMYPVPQFWTKYKELNLPSVGVATYRVTIKTGHEDQTYGILLPEIYTEYCLWINGEKLDSSGRIDSTPFRYLNPNALTFHSESKTIEIVLQVCNQSHVYAGIGQSFLLGTQKNILRQESLEILIDLVLVGVCLFTGLYHLVLFLYRRHDYKLACFACFCFVVAVRGLLTNSSYLMKLYPQLPFSVGYRIVMASVPIIVISMVLYTYFVFQNKLSKRLTTVYMIISLCYLFIIATTDSYFYSRIITYYFILPVSFCVIALFVSYREAVRGRRGALWFFMGAVLIAAGAVNDILFFTQEIDTGYRLGFALAGFAIIQSCSMAMHYSRLTNERKELYEKLHRTDLAFMQAQIKPHFIYNTLSSIAHQINKDPKQAKRLVLDFSDYLRGCFDFENTSGLTTLSKEMEIVMAYLSIEQARYRDRLNVKWEFEVESDVLIPLLCIQPIVENAVQHGLMKRAEGGCVAIRSWKKDGDTHIRVEDDGVGIPEEKLEKIFDSGASTAGLSNINGRLRLRFGTELTIISRINAGTSVEIVIPDQIEGWESEE